MQTAAAAIRFVSVHALVTQGRELVQQHYEELVRRKDVMRLDPDLTRYELLERNGVLFTLAAVVDEQLVGYSVNLVQPHLHYRELTVCYNDVLFLAASQRRTGIGAQLLTATEQTAKAKGAKLMLWHVKPETAMERVLARRDYSVQDVVFGKVL